MSAIPKVKVYEKLVPFSMVGAENFETENPETSLENLDVFHRNFSQTEELPAARKLNKTYDDGLEEGHALAVQEGALHLQEIEQLIHMLGENLAILGGQIQASHRRAISSIIRSVLPKLAKQAAGVEISRFVTEISGQALTGQVNYKVSPAYKTHLETIIAGLEKKGMTTPEFSIEEDTGLVGNAVSASWRSGGGSIDIDGAVGHCLSLLGDET